MIDREHSWHETVIRLQMTRINLRQNISNTFSLSRCRSLIHQSCIQTSRWPSIPSELHRLHTIFRSIHCQDDTRPPTSLRTVLLNSRGSRTCRPTSRTQRLNRPQLTSFTRPGLSRRPGHQLSMMSMMSQKTPTIPKMKHSPTFQSPEPLSQSSLPRRNSSGSFLVGSISE